MSKTDTPTQPRERLDRMPVSVYLTPTMWKLLDARAAAEKRNRSDMVRTLIESALRNEDAS